MGDSPVEIESLKVGRPLFDFLETEALPESGVEATQFWQGLSDLIHGFRARNRALLHERTEIQARIDGWHRQHYGEALDIAGYRAFLWEIGYLLPEGEDFHIGTRNVDAEIAFTPGPQLIVPVTNARYAINAANARWGSLYDALYGTDALGSPPPSGPYDPRRGGHVVKWVRDFLDRSVPLDGASHADGVAYWVSDGQVAVDLDGRRVGLADPSQFVGYTGSTENPDRLMLRNNGLHIEFVIDRRSPVGRTDSAGIADVFLESAVTTIIDCEDSVATVDATDKAGAYRNWLGLIRGDLTAEVEKGGTSFTRTLNADREIVAPDGTSATLPGRSLMLVRNVGHLMTTPAVIDREGHQAFEGLVDAICTVLIAKHDLLGNRTHSPNSKSGSIYVVKPKMHGPAEIEFADDVFTFVEEVLGLARNTVKIGLMDEERRTTLNLKEGIRAVRHRVAFINTGFLDRTGDEIHTSMEAGPMIPKTEMKKHRWLQAYEDWNVYVGLACGFHQRAQIGKGMWAAPDNMEEMLREKIEHPLSGANCAWVPSPSAATLHATHYHQVDVLARQAALAGQQRVTIDDLLEIPLGNPSEWSEAQIEEELENNAQSILGYVVRWIEQGIGCSKVPNIDDVPLMEDRATCRISSQHIANWLRHGVVSEAEVLDAMKRMARVVDGQNRGDPLYEPMAPDFDGQAFLAARDLILKGTEQPSGYTEPILHGRRIGYKATL